MKKEKEQGRGIFCGGLSGFMTGCVFAFFLLTTNITPQMLYMRLFDKIHLYQKIGDFFGISGDAVLYILHFMTAVALGIVFGLLFHRLVKTIWSGIGLGCLYGVIWWLLTPFYIAPFLFMVSPKEMLSLISAFTLLNSLLGHVIFGTLIGLFFGIFTKCLKRKHGR